MIIGIVAQEPLPLPHGVFAPIRTFDDDEAVFFAVVTSGLDQRLFPRTVVLDDDPIDGEMFFAHDMPTMLTVEAIYDEASDRSEKIILPLVAIGRQLLPGFYTSADVIPTADIRVPGFLLPRPIASDDVIFATPLILDPGMLRQDVPHSDLDLIPSPVLAAAQTMFPLRVTDADVLHIPKLLSGVLGPPFFIHDDVIFNFATVTRLQIPLYIDEARPVTPAIIWDGVNFGVNISSDGLTAALATEGNYRGARTALTKQSGKYYWEVTLGPLHGIGDQAGVIQEAATFTQMTQATISNYSLGMFANYHVFGINDIYVSGAVIGNGHWFCYFGHVPASPGEFVMAEGDVIGIAVNLNDRTCWFRCNGGPWNNDQRGLSVLLNQDPVTGVGGLQLPNGRMGPAVTLGGVAGDGRDGLAGDNWTANFGKKAFRSQPPNGYVAFDYDSAFGQPSGGDSFGKAIIAIPASLNDGAVNVTMTNNLLTATHNTTADDSGVQSASSQQYGRYYFEVTIGSTHGRDDAVGILIDSPISLGSATPEGDIGRFSSGTACGNVFLSSGAIYANGSNSNKNIGVVVAGDVVGVAVDLTVQTATYGGSIWFRKKHAGVTSFWNGAAFAEDADPVTGLGAIALGGLNFTRTWVPAVGFAGPSTQVGDSMTANFGATPYAMVRPGGYAVWPVGFNDGVATALMSPIPHDDTFLVPSVDTANKQIQATTIVADPDTIFPTQSRGGNLLLIPLLGASDDVVYAAGNYPYFDSASPQVALSNNNLTATNTATTPYIGARSSAQQNTGKYYFEVLWAGAHGTQDAVAILQEQGTYKNICTDFTNCCNVVGNGGIIGGATGISGRSLGAPVAGDIIGVAVNFDIRKIWFRRNGGLWNGNATENPDTGVSSVNMAPLVSFAPAVGFNSAIGNSFTLNLGVLGYTFPPPIGFSIWPGNSLTQPALKPGLATDNETFPVPRVDPQTVQWGFLASDDAIPLPSGAGGNPTMAPATAADANETIYAPAMAIIATTLDSGQLLNATLSNGNLTATHTNTTTDSGARSVAYRSAGKFYFEVTMNNIHGSFDCCGILLAGASYNNFVTSSINCVATFKGSGNIWANNVSSGKTLGAIVAGDVISWAIDFDARKAWVRKNGGNWNGLALGSENPNTGLGGVTIAAGAFAPAIGFGGSSTAAGDNQTANFGATPFAFLAPSGFSTSWPAAAPPVLATLDGANNDVTLSGGNLIVTHSTTNTPAGVRSTALKTSGKYYFEITVNVANGGSDAFGAITAVGTLGQLTALGTGSVSVRRFTGLIYSNGGSTGKTLSAVANGATLGFALDLTARLAWVRKSGGLWNNDATADPATGVGGVVIQAGDQFSPVVSLAGTGTLVGDQMTCNCGQSAFANAAPAGFGNWTLP